MKQEKSLLTQSQSCGAELLRYSSYDKCLMRQMGSNTNIRTILAEDISVIDDCSVTLVRDNSHLESKKLCERRACVWKEGKKE